MPSANTWRFHTGSRAFTSSTSRAHAANAVGPVRGGDGGGQRHVADPQRADPVRHRHRVHRRVGGDLRGDLAQHRLGPGVPLVLQLVTARPWSWSRTTPAKDTTAPARPVGHRPLVGGHVERPRWSPADVTVGHHRSPASTAAARAGPVPGSARAAGRDRPRTRPSWPARAASPIRVGHRVGEPVAGSSAPAPGGCNRPGRGSVGRASPWPAPAAARPGQPGQQRRHQRHQRHHRRLRVARQAGHELAARGPPGQQHREPGPDRHGVDDVLGARARASAGCRWSTGPCMVPPVVQMMSAPASRRRGARRRAPRACPATGPTTPRRGPARAGAARPAPAGPARRAPARRRAARRSAVRRRRRSARPRARGRTTQRVVAAGGGEPDHARRDRRAGRQQLLAAGRLLTRLAATPSVGRGRR